MNSHHQERLNKAWGANSRPRPSQGQRGRGRGRGSRYRRQQQQRYHVEKPLSSAAYMLSKFSLTVRPTSQKNNENNYRLHEAAMDEDYLVDWDVVEWVRFSSQKEIVCPICLEKPVCPKITKCGHIFCYSCMIHYMDVELNDDDAPKSWKKCPMCSHSVYKGELKSCEITMHKTFQVGEKISFDLMRRPKDSLIHFRAKNLNAPQTAIFPIEKQPDSELARYNVTYDILPILKRELSEIYNALDNSLTMTESLYLEEAQNRVLSRMKEWKLWKQKHLFQGNPLDAEKKEDKKVETIQISGAEEAFGPCSDSEEEEIEPEPTPEIDPDSSEHNYYYYQSEDGQNYYLHSTNHRMFMSDSQDFAKMSRKIENAKILEIETIKMNEMTKRRYHYLNNLPYNSTVHFVEIDMKGLVSKETLKKFENQIRRRKHERLNKKYRELKEDKATKKRVEEAQKKAEERLRKEMYGPSNVSIQEVPTQDDFVPLGTEPVQTPPPQHQQKQQQQWNNYRKSKYEQLFGESIPSHPKPELSGAWGKKPTKKSKPAPRQQGNMNQVIWPNLDTNTKKRGRNRRSKRGRR